MSTIVYTNAKLLVNGVEIAASLSDLAVDYTSEMLDATTFGNDTRINKGGLFKGAINGKGFVDSATGMELILFQLGSGALLTFNPAYQSAVELEDTLFVVFPDGVTEGSVTTGVGYAMKGALNDYKIGGTVGKLLELTFSAESRGISA